MMRVRVISDKKSEIRENIDKVYSKLYLIINTGKGDLKKYLDKDIITLYDMFYPNKQNLVPQVPNEMSSDVIDYTIRTLKSDGIVKTLRQKYYFVKIRW